jgi:hypothetical protein
MTRQLSARRGKATSCRGCGVASITVRRATGLCRGCRRRQPTKGKP